MSDVFLLHIHLSFMSNPGCTHPGQPWSMAPRIHDTLLWRVHPWLPAFSYLSALNLGRLRYLIKTKIPILWPSAVKTWLIGKDTDVGKDWRQEEKGMTEDEMVRWHHRYDGHELAQVLGVGDEQGYTNFKWALSSAWQLSISLVWLIFLSPRQLFLIFAHFKLPSPLPSSLF